MEPKSWYLIEARYGDRWGSVQTFEDFELDKAKTKLLYENARCSSEPGRCREVRLIKITQTRELIA
jgi:hypothetical protein